MVDCSNKITILSDSLCLTAWVNRSPLTHLVVYSGLVARKCLSKPNKFETLSVCLELAIVDCFFFPSSSSSATVLALYSIFFYNEHISVCVTTTGEKEKKNTIDSIFQTYHFLKGRFTFGTRNASKLFLPNDLLRKTFDKN